MILVSFFFVFKRTIEHRMGERMFWSVNDRLSHEHKLQRARRERDPAPSFSSFSIQGWSPCRPLHSPIVRGRVRSGASGIFLSPILKTGVFLAFSPPEVAPHANVRVTCAPGAWIPAENRRLDARPRRASFHHCHCPWRMKSFIVVFIHCCSYCSSSPQ